MYMSSKEMKFTVLLCLLCQVQTTACSVNLLTSATTALTEALQQSSCLSLAINITSEAPLVFESMLTLASLQLACNGATLLIEPTVEVQLGKELSLSDCHLQGRNSGLLDVYGHVTLLRCTVTGNKDYTLKLEGTALVESSTFANNKKTIFLSQKLGFSLIVRNSLFENNSSPFGVVLLFRAISYKPQSSTLISFEESLFTKNTASFSGSVFYLSGGALNIGSSLETHFLIVKNCKFRDSLGYLFYMHLIYIDAVLSNNSIANVTLPFYLQLLSHSMSMENTTISNVEKAIVCTGIREQLYIRNMLVENASDGPALLFTHISSSSPGAVLIQGLEMRNLTQVDTTLYVSTIYVFNLLASLEDVWIHHSYSFAAGCGAFVFAESQVSNCSFTHSVSHQGALIGHSGGHGVVFNLTLREVYVESMSAVLVMRASVELANISIVYTDAGNPPRLNNLFVFISSVISCADIYADLPPTQTELLIRVQDSAVSLSGIYFKLLRSLTFFQAIQSNVTMTDVSADVVEVQYFASVTIDSNLQLRQVKFINSLMLEGLVSAKTRCTVDVEHIQLLGGVCHSLAVNFGSRVQLKDVLLNQTMSGTLFSVYLGGSIEVTDLTILNSTCNLVNCENGSVAVTSALLAEIWIAKRLITLKNATTVLKNVRVSGLYSSTFSPLLQATTSSTLQVSSCQWQRIKSRDLSLMHVSNSMLVLEYTRISDFNTTFAYLSKSSFFILQSEITYGGTTLPSRYSKTAPTAGFIDSTDSVGVVSMSRFHSISGSSGGVFAVQSETGVAELSIEDTHFEHCSALLHGGVISAQSAALNISHSTFINNSARSGGVLYFECDSVGKCPSSMAFSEFHNNSAVEGGVLKWTKVKPSQLGLLALHNTAVYGHFEASLPTHIALDPDALFMYGVAGTRMATSIVILALDSLNQTVTTDNSSIVQLASDHIIGTNVLPTLNGVANFSGVIVETAPGNYVQIQVLSPTILQAFPNSSHSFNFTYYTRLCVSGEITLSLSCFLCPKNTYSLHPSDTYCHDCPSYATCPGGNSLILDSGYWRESDLSSEVHLCPNSEACAGGINSSCADGYSGVLCSSCQQGYFLVSTVKCEECEGVIVVVIRSCAVYMIALSCMIYIVNRLESQGARMMTVRLLADFLHFLLILPLIPVNYPSTLSGFLTFNEMIVSFGLHSFPLDCWVSPALVWRAVMTTAFPVVYFLITLVVFRIRGDHPVVNAVNSGILLLWWTQPYIVRTLMNLLACKKQAGYWVLISDTDVVCWEGIHWKYLLGLFMPGFLIYCVAYPIALFFILSKYCQRINSCYLTLGLAKDLNQEAKNCVKKQFLLILAALLGALDCLFQVLVVAGTLYFLLTWSRHIYLERAHYLLNGVGLLLQTYFVAVSYYFVARLRLNPYILTTISSLIFTISLLYILTCFALMRKLITTAAVASLPPETTSPVSLDDIHLVPQPSPASSLSELSGSQPIPRN